MAAAVDFSYAAGESHAALTFFALAVATHLEEPFRTLLLLLADCAGCADSEAAGQLRGASYRSLLAIADLAGLEDEEDRARWVRIAEGVPLSERHADHLLEKLRKEEAA